MNLRDHVIIDTTLSKLDDLIAACRRGTTIYTHSPNLAADVTRKAKSLRTSLTGLTASLDGKPVPFREEPIRRELSSVRIYSSPLLADMIQFVGKDGRSELEFWDFYREVAKKYGQERVSGAKEELLDIDTATLPATVRIKPHVLSLCGLLLGRER